MKVMTLYGTAVVLFVLGLAALGGAVFGRRRRQRVLLVVGTGVLWAAALLLSSCASSVDRTQPTPGATAVAPQPTATPASPTSAPTATAVAVSPLPTAGAQAVDSTPPARAPITATAVLIQAPPVPGRIAFHSARAGELDIYTMNADGTDVQRLTDSPGRDFEPDWSPDGQSIVFSSDRDDPENAQLYLMASDGSSPRALLPLSASDYIAPRWSPDGAWILFHANQPVDGELRFEIYKVRPDGTGMVNVSNAPGNNFRGDWSPDGERIVFVSERDGNRELYVMNADGSNQVRLTESQADDNRPRWSPDGKSILFESNRDGDNTALYLMDAPSVVSTAPQEDTIRLLTFPGFNSQTGAWVAGGEKIVFSGDRDSGSVQNWDIYIMDADGAAIYRLTADPELDRFPAWTP